MAVNNRGISLDHDITPSGRNFVLFALKIIAMPKHSFTADKYKFLYKFLAVLDGNQVHKLHKIVSGLLDVSVFSKEEIDSLEKRLASNRLHTHYAV